MAELASWIANASPETATSARDDFRQYLSAGLTPEQSFALSQERPKKKRGRPVSKRRVAVDALEMRLQNPKLSWTRVAIKVCSCGAPKHDSQCGQRIRIQTIELTGTLKRLGV